MRRLITNEQVRRLERKRVKAEWRSQGRRIDGLHYDFHQAVMAYLREHGRELTDVDPTSPQRQLVGEI
jgi:hypothetical protein